MIYPWWNWKLARMVDSWSHQLLDDQMSHMSLVLPTPQAQHFQISSSFYSLGKSIRSKLKLNISNYVYPLYDTSIMYITKDIQANVTSNVFTQTVTMTSPCFMAITFNNCDTSPKFYPYMSESICTLYKKYANVFQLKFSTSAFRKIMNPISLS